MLNSKHLIHLIHHIIHYFVVKDIALEGLSYVTSKDLADILAELGIETGVNMVARLDDGEYSSSIFPVM